jgi:hypothetical protein
MTCGSQRHGPEIVRKSPPLEQIWTTADDRQAETTRRVLSGGRSSHQVRPMTLGNTAAARVRLIVWCKACGHRAEPEPAEIARRHGGETSVPEWCERLVCSRCGIRDVDMVVTGTERR